MEQKEELILYQAYGFVKMKIYSYTDGNYKNYFGILDRPEQEGTVNIESDKIAVKIGQQLEKALENKFSFSQLVNSGKPLICGVYPKTREDFKLQRFSLQYIYSDKSKSSSKLNLFIIRGKVDYINLENQLIIIKIVPQTRNLKEFDMAVKCQDITHELENIKLGQFWEINAELVDNEFRLKSGSMIQDKRESNEITNSTPILKSELVVHKVSPEDNKVSHETDNNTSSLVGKKAPTSEPQLINFDFDNNKTTDMAPTVETELINAASTKAKKKKKKTSDVVIQEARVQQEEGETRGEGDKGNNISLSPTPNTAHLKETPSSKEKTDNKTTIQAPIQTPTLLTHIASDVADSKTHINKKSKTSDVATQQVPVTETQLINVAKDKTDNKAASDKEKQLITEQTVPQETNRMMQVRSEITIKISGSLPQAAPAANKKVQVEITDQNGINFTAILNPKSWKKAEASVAQFSDWSGMISGKLGKTEQGLEIIDAGIQIFERKSKEIKQEETKQEGS